MRSPSSAAAALCLLAAGCGNWSNEDVRFLAALPTRDELRVVVPASAASVAEGPASGALAAVAPIACGGLGAARTWGWAKPTSDRLNASIDWVIGLVDLVRRVPPTTRLEDGRVWGPFDDDKHPGIELRIVIQRFWPNGPQGEAEHAYTFGARHKAGGQPFSPILSGTFVGPSAQRGRGDLVLRFDLIRALGMEDANSPDGVMQVTYDRVADPRTVGLTLAQTGGFGLARFDYGFVGYAEGSGRLSYAFVNVAGDRAEVAAGWNALGGGQADVRYFPASAGGAWVGYHQCWDASACLVYSDDVNGYSCGGASCAGGLASDCAAVPPP